MSWVVAVETGGQMKRFVGDSLERLIDRDSGAVFENMEFVKCEASTCTLSSASRPELRSVVRNIKIAQCRIIGGYVGSAVFEDVTVDGLRSSALVQVLGAVYKHVVLRGRICRLGLYGADDAAFSEADKTYYRSVDWALDISEAECTELDVSGVPAKLIRRDPRTQVVVSRSNAREGLWRKLDLSDPYWGVELGALERSDDEAWVIVAPKRHTRFSRILEGLKTLRDAGIAEQG